MFVNKKYYISVIPVIEDFQQVLAEVIGPTAYYLNIVYLAERALDLMFHGRVLGDPQYMDRFLEGIKVPTEKKEELSVRFYNDFNRAVFTILRDYRPNHTYEYTVTELGDVCIEDLGNNNISVLSSKPLVGPEVDTETYLEEIRKNIDNGDYVPEKLRRLVI